MAGLITSVDIGQTGTLGAFLTGSTAATASGRVEQFRNNLKFDFGDIITGATSDGVLFDIRVNSAADYEFGKNLSFRSNQRDGVLDAGDALIMDASAVRRRFEQTDLARTAYGLLLASKGEIDEAELNSNPAFSGLFVLEREDALDRLNIDSKKSFRINGVSFEIEGDEIRILSRPGQATGSRAARDPEIADLRAKLAKRSKAIDAPETKRVKVEGATVNELIGVREDLEQAYTYVAYSFKTSEFIGTDKLGDVLDTMAEVADGFFFGANMAFQIEELTRDTLPAAARNELFPVTVNYFSSLVLGAMTGLPTQLREEYGAHAAAVLSNVFRGDEQKISDALDAIADPFNRSVDRVLDTVSQIELGADLKAVRTGLGIRYAGNTYTVPKYASAF